MTPFSLRQMLRFAALIAMTVGSVHAQTFVLNLPLPNDPDVVLQSIAMQPDETRIMVLLRNSTQDTFEACAHATGTPDAFALTDLDTGQLYPQKAVKGLPDCKGAMEQLRPGDLRIFALTFAGLPANARQLRLGENNCRPKPGSAMNYWCFDNVKLPAR